MVKRFFIWLLIVILVIAVAVGLTAVSINSYVQHKEKDNIVSAITENKDSLMPTEIKTLKKLNADCILVLGAGIKDEETPTPMLKDRLDVGIMVRTDKTTLLIDVGITGKRVLAGLSENSVDPESIDGILITHEHIDHVRSLRMIGKKASNAEVFASAGTLNMISDKVPLERTHPLPEEGGFLIGDIEVNPFPLSHVSGQGRTHYLR